MKPDRLRKFTLWTGTTLSLLIAAAFGFTSMTRGVRFAVPLVNTFAIVVVLTLIVWVWPKLNPKPNKLGHCRCGYDWTGNTSGVCPECGIEVQP